MQNEEEVMTQEIDPIFFNKLRSAVEARLGEDWVKSIFTDRTQVRESKAPLLFL